MAYIAWPAAPRVGTIQWDQTVPRIRQRSSWTGKARDVSLGPADRWRATASLNSTGEPAAMRLFVDQMRRSGGVASVPMTERPQGEVSGNLARDSSFEGVDWWFYNNGGAGGTLTQLAGGMENQLIRATAGATPGTTLGVLRPDAVIGGWRSETDYVVSVYARRSAGAAGMTGVVLGWNRFPSSMVVLANPALDTSWQRYAFRLRWAEGRPLENSGGGGVLYLSRAGTHATGDYIEFDNLMVEEAQSASAWSRGLFLSAAAAATTGAFDGAAPSVTLARAGDRITIPLADGTVQAVTLATNLQSDASGTGTATWVQPLRAAAAAALVAHRWPFCAMQLVGGGADSVASGPVYSFEPLQLEEYY